jgi:hypothetical protein
LTKNLKALATSINSRLSDIARKSQKPFPHVLTEFLLERVAERLASNLDLAKHVVFKGGYVGLKVHRSPRYTIDLDALAVGISLVKAAKLAKAAIEDSAFDDGVWFVFEEFVDLKTQDEYGGSRLVFRAGIGELIKNIKKAQIINVDFATGDSIIPDPIKTETPLLLGNGSLSWTVYPPETTVSEKLHAMITLGDANSRSKDLFDINFLLPKCNADLLQFALLNTFKSRKDDPPKDLINQIKKIDTAVLRRGWRRAIGGLAEENNFDETFAKMIKKLEEIF